MSLNKLTVRISEIINLGKGIDYDTFFETNVDGINEVSKRRVTVPTSSEKEILAFDSSIGSGTFIENDIRYARITNIGSDSSESDPSGSAEIRLTLKNTNNEEFAFRLPSGKSFMYNGRNKGDILGVSQSMAASGSALSSSLDEVFATLSNITAQSSGSNCNLEFFVASS